jgi:hypothetical protein
LTDENSKRSGEKWKEEEDGKEEGREVEEVKVS